MMFEVGKEYEFTVIEMGEEGLEDRTHDYTVVRIDGALLHLLSPAIEVDGSPLEEFMPPSIDENIILNTASAFFLKARPKDEIKKADELNRAWMQSRAPGSSSF